MKLGDPKQEIRWMVLILLAAGLTVVAVLWFVGCTPRGVEPEFYQSHYDGGYYENPRYTPPPKYPTLVSEDGTVIPPPK